MDDPKVILVDRNDNEIGIMGKMDAHRKAKLHRALSVFVCNSKGEWLLQQRAMDKYHSGGLWTNTCCSHPYPNETSMDAANRRLREEMGIECELTELFSFIYKEKLDNELTEHELDHVFLGISDSEPLVDDSEIMAWKYIRPDDLKRDIALNPSDYTVWFKKIVGSVQEHIERGNGSQQHI